MLKIAVDTASVSHCGRLLRAALVHTFPRLLVATSPIEFGEEGKCQCHLPTIVPTTMSSPASCAGFSRNNIVSSHSYFLLLVDILFSLFDVRIDVAPAFQK